LNEYENELSARGFKEEYNKKVNKNKKEHIFFME
jgi:hypothetical protein